MRIGDKYDDNTASAATRCTIVGNTWVDCAPLQIGLEREDKKLTYLPTACTFTRNWIVRTRTHSKPAVIAGLMRDLQAADNLAYDVQGMPAVAWAAWFLWGTERPDIAAPKMLTSADVGPDAP